MLIEFNIFRIDVVKRMIRSDVSLVIQLSHYEETEMKLKNKVAFVTGGSSGIGLETAKLFQAEGVLIAAEN
jgi:hypothetical protein